MMSFERFERKPEIPTGKGRELSKELQNWLLLFETVKNKVVFVNPEVKMPFKLEEGKESPLGLFVKSTLPEIFEREPGQQRLETWPEHKRSALLGRVIFKDKQGRLYCDLSLKGIGFIEEKEIKIPGPPYILGGCWGLVENKDAFKEYNLSEKFLSAGIRTARVLAIINLEELIISGEKISLEETKRRGIIKEKIQPVIEVVGFRTKARITEISMFKMEKETENLFLKDAQKLVNQELGREKNPLSTQEYLQWFAETLGKNLGLMHKNRWHHGYLSRHNITLTCEICDLDSVDELKTEKQRWVDEYSAGNSLDTLVRACGVKYPSLKFRKDYFQKIYNSVFPPEERKFLEKE